MKIATVLGDMVRSLLHRPVTQHYPMTHQPTPQRLRGPVRWNPQKCTGCCLCSKDCPANAIEVIMVDKAQRRFVIRYHVDRCAFCGQCVQSCRSNCLEMSNEDWELAKLSKEPFTVYYGDENDIRAILEKSTTTKDTPTHES